MASLTQSFTRLCLVASAALLASGCPKNVDGRANSGKDYRYKGAKKIALEDGEGRSKKDIITYPGGDREDWKVFEVPEGQAGTLKVRLQWRPPRPGLDLAFNVYDAYFNRIAQAKPSKKSRSRSKKVTIEGAEAGKYYVQVYAPERGDAGTYRVSLRFRPGGEAGTDGEPMPAGPGEIPDPPTLAAIPEGGDAPPEGGGTTLVPGGETPPGGTGGTGGTTPVGPGGEGTTEPAVAEPVRARVVKYQLAGGAVLITVDRGKNAGVDRGWKGQILSGSGRPVQGGEFTVTKVTGAEASGKVSMSVDQIKANKKVLLSPP